MLVAGTGTEVGKTWVSVRLLTAWRAAGLSVAARKPAQSYQPGEGLTDAELLAQASGEDPATVCPPARWYPVPMAPPMAAEALDRAAPTLADLMAAVGWSPAGVQSGPEPAAEAAEGPSARPGTRASPGDAAGVAVGLVETAGGVRSPQAADADVTDLVGALAPAHLVLVADAGLGTVNAVRLSADALAGAGDVPLTVVLNRFDHASDLHRRNRAWLAERCGLTVVPGTEGALADLAARLAQDVASAPRRRHRTS